MLRLKTLTLGALLALTVQGRTLTIDECCALARENYPMTAQYGIIDATRELTLSAASKAWLPQVAVGGKASWQSQVTELPQQLEHMLAQLGSDYPGMKHLQYQAAVEVSQTIWDGGAIADKRADARAKAAVATRQTDLALYEVDGKVQEVCFTILLLNSQLRQLLLTETLLDSTLAKVNSLVTNGVALRADACQVEAQLLGLKQSIVSVRSSADACRRVLALFTGVPADEIELVEPREPLGHPTQSSELPQQALFNARLAGLDAGERAIRSSLMPRIGAFASAQYSYPSANMFKSMRTGDPGFGVTAGVNLRWEIGSFYTRSQRRRLIDAERRQIETERQTADFNKQIAAENITGEIRTLTSTVADDEKIAALRTEVRRAAESQLANGVIDTTSLLDKITDEQTALLNRNLHVTQLLRQYYLLNHTLNK